ncbi:MAG: hypothetical protein RBR67_19525 [Desulfobacterium sp.]|nr:hypothetical protein [Desulfobacterium sp.]MDY0376234.1 hypothetical protein [Desulfobacterium sp.]
MLEFEENKHNLGEIILKEYGKILHTGFESLEKFIEAVCQILAK